MNEKQLEAAARQYCTANNLAPDDSVGHCAEPDEYGRQTLAIIYSPRWKLITRQIKQHYLMNEAIQWGLKTAP